MRHDECRVRHFRVFRRLPKIFIFLKSQNRSLPVNICSCTFCSCPKNNCSFDSSKSQMGLASFCRTSNFPVTRNHSQSHLPANKRDCWNRDDPNWATSFHYPIFFEPGQLNAHAVIWPFVLLLSIPASTKLSQQVKTPNT